MTSAPRITLVTAVYNEEASLAAYREAVERTLFQQKDVEFEVLFVDDGSTDRSWEIIETYCRDSERFRALRLSRNFGAHTADSAGIDHANGDAVVPFACDLQDPPEVVLQFVHKWRAGAQVVWGRRRERAESRLRVLGAQILFWLMRTNALPRGSKFSTGGFFLIDRRVVECFRQFREQNRLTFALVALTGFAQDEVLYDRPARHSGSSGWRLGRIAKTVYDALLGFSNLLPRFITFLGAGIFLATIPLVAYFIANDILNRPIPGWTGLMVVMCFFFGIVCLMLGIMSEYLYRIYLESTRRPLYFITRYIGVHAEALDVEAATKSRPAEGDVASS